MWGAARGAARAGREGQGVTVTAYDLEAECLCDGVNDGEELARLMVVHEIGVRTRIRYTVNRIDEEYFAGEDL